MIKNNSLSIDSLLFNYKQAHDRIKKINYEKNNIGKNIRKSKVDVINSKIRFIFFLPLFFYFFILTLKFGDFSIAFFNVYGEESVDQIACWSSIIFCFCALFYDNVSENYCRQFSKYKNFKIKINMIGEYLFFISLSIFILSFIGLANKGSFFITATNHWGFVLLFYGILVFSLITFKMNKSNKLTDVDKKTFERLNKEEEEGNKHFNFLKNLILENEQVMRHVVKLNEKPSFQYKDEYPSYKILIVELQDISKKIKEKNKENEKIQASLNNVYKNDSNNLHKVLIENK